MRSALDLAMEETVTVPHMEEWPYDAIASEFGPIGEEVPTFLFVGRALWKMLRKVSTAPAFYVHDTVRVRRDPSGILEPHEFMFSRK